MTTVHYHRPWLYPKQLDAIFDPHRYSITEASTKAGKTVACIIWLAEQAMAGKAGQHFWWVAPVYKQADIAYSRMCRALPKEVFKKNDSDLTITLGNGAIIEFKTGEKPDNLYGEDVYAAVIDEASRVREESWHAVRSTLTATRGPIRIIGNVRGRKNWAYRLGRRAESGDPDMGYHKLTAYDAIEAGVLAESEIENARTTLPADVFRELYEAEPSDDSGNPFGYEAIHACIGTLSEEPPHWWGWDLAKSVDWTVGIAFDHNGQVCNFQRFQADWFQTGLRIRSLCEGRPTLLDATGVGDPVVEELQRYGGNYEAFKFTPQSKQQLMEGLAVAIQQHEITYPDGEIVNELESFEYEYSRVGVKYTAPEGLHDDCVCALALAVQCMRKAVTPNVRMLTW